MADPITIGLMVASTALSAYSSYQQGREEKNALDAQAALAKQDASLERSAASRRAEEAYRQGREKESRALALAAFGGSPSGESAEAHITKLAGQSHYFRRVELYEGEAKARRLEDQATEYRRQGKAAKRAGTLKAVTNVISGGAGISKHMSA